MNINYLKITNLNLECNYYTKPFLLLFSGTFPKKIDQNSVIFRERSRKSSKILLILH